MPISSASPTPKVYIPRKAINRPSARSVIALT
jgi:hypothetical protein